MPLTLNVEQQTNLQEYIKQCDLNEKNLESTKQAFDACTATVGSANGWWQTPTGAASLGLGGLIIGILLGSLAN